MRLSSLLSCFIIAFAQAQFADLPPPAYDEARDFGEHGRYPSLDFKTFKDNVKAPKVNFLHWSPECDDGLYTFLTPRGWELMHQPGPMILDSRGELVWAHHYQDVNRLGNEGYNFLVQNYRGKDHLTVWVGEDRVKGHGAGIIYFLNGSYDVVDRMHGGNGMFADLHEFLLTDDNTALLTLYQIVPGDVTQFRSFDPYNQEEREPNFVWDGVVQEVDLRTRAVKWQWRAVDHVDLNETYRPIHHLGTHTNPWDWFHINSVQKDELGNYLISSRFTQCIRYVDGRTKKTIWRLGGKRNSFMDLSGGNATNFAWQHDARFHPVGTFPNLYTPPPQRRGFTTTLMTFFDNASENQNYTYGLPLSRGLLLELTYPTPGTRRANTGPKMGDEIRHFDETQDWSRLDINEAKVQAINGTDPDYTVRVIMSYDSPTNIRASSQGNLQLIPQGPGKDPRVLVGYGLDAAWTQFTSDGKVLCDVHWAASTSFETGDMQSYRTYKFPWTGKPKWKPKVVLQNAKLYVSWLGATDIAEWALQVSETNSTEEGAWRDASRTRKIHFEETIPLPHNVENARFLRMVALDKTGARMQNGISDLVYAGFLTSYTPDPEQETSLLKISSVILFAIGIVVFVYAVYLLYPSMRWSKPFRWQKDVAYQLVDQSDRS